MIFVTQFLLTSLQFGVQEVAFITIGKKAKTLNVTLQSREMLKKFMYGLVYHGMALLFHFYIKILVKIAFFLLKIIKNG
jgi:hypothetical protein